MVPFDALEQQDESRLAAASPCQGHARLSVRPVEARSVALLNGYLEGVAGPRFRVEVLESEIEAGRLVLRLRGGRSRLRALVSTLQVGFPELNLGLSWD